MLIKNKVKSTIQVLSLSAILVSSGCVTLASAITGPIYGGIEGFEKGMEIAKQSDSPILFPLLPPLTTLAGIISGPFAGTITGAINEFYFIQNKSYPSELSSSIANPIKYGLAILEGLYPPCPNTKKQ